MNRGERIRRYRKLRHMTQLQLAEAVGLGESAIRNYELGLRDPSQEVLSALSEALDVPVSALDDYEIESARDALEALFRLEDSFGLKPNDAGDLAIDPKAKGAQKLAAAIKAWKGAIEEVESGEMTRDEYDLWRGSFGQ